MSGNYKNGRFRPLFLAAKKGDTFTLTVNDWADGDKDRFLPRVQTTRSMYKQSHGVLTGMVRSADGLSVELTVLSAAGEGSEVKIIEAAPGVDPNKKPKREPEPKAEEPPPVVVYNDEARAFYREVFMSGMRMMPGAKPEHCAQQATQAARDYMQRFG